MVCGFSSGDRYNKLKTEKRYSIAIPVGNGWYNRVIVSSNGNVTLDSHNYISLDKLRRHDRQSSIPLTEDLIKNSELAWAWLRKLIRAYDWEDYYE